jgi:hypothetical protein
MHLSLSKLGTKVTRSKLPRHNQFRSQGDKSVPWAFRATPTGFKDSCMRDNSPHKARNYGMFLTASQGVRMIATARKSSITISNLSKKAYPMPFKTIAAVCAYRTAVTALSTQCTKSVTCTPHSTTRAVKDKVIECGTWLRQTNVTTLKFKCVKKRPKKVYLPRYGGVRPLRELGDS